MAFRPNGSSNSSSTSASQRRQEAAAPAAGGAPEAVNKADTHILAIYGILIVFSLVELYSASSFEVATQGLYMPVIRHFCNLLVGFLLVMGLQRVHYRYFFRWGSAIFWLSVASMVYVSIFGEIVNGARRAISLPFFSFQPAELMKLSAVLILAKILSSSQMKKNESERNIGIIKAVLVVVLMGGLLFSQGLTNTLIVMCISMAMFVLSGMEWRKIGIVILVYMLLGVGGMASKIYMARQADSAPAETTVLVDSKGRVLDIPEAASKSGNAKATTNRAGTWLARVKKWGHDSVPKYEKPIDASNLQEMRSYMAQAHGGLHGVLPGNSRETSRLPLAFSDYIYAIVVEDFGFIGGFVLMVLYLWLLARAYNVARRCYQVYPAFLVSGMAMMITLQALCHMAIVTGTGPVSGQPLPLYSKGGTSILVTSMAIGIMLSVSRFAVRNNTENNSRQQINREADALPEEARGANPTQF
jgi:cell division protein FtsW